MSVHMSRENTVTEMFTIAQTGGVISDECASSIAHFILTDADELGEELDPQDHYYLSILAGGLLTSEDATAWHPMLDVMLANVNLAHHAGLTSDLDLVLIGTVHDYVLSVSQSEPIVFDGSAAFEATEFEAFLNSLMSEMDVFLDDTEEELSMWESEDPYSNLDLDGKDSDNPDDWF